LAAGPAEFNVNMICVRILAVVEVLPPRPAPDRPVPDYVIDTGLVSRLNKNPIEIVRNQFLIRPMEKTFDLNAILSVVETRQMTSDYTLRFQGKIYRIGRKDVRPGLRGGNVRIEVRSGGSVHARSSSVHPVCLSQAWGELRERPRNGPNGKKGAACCAQQQSITFSAQPSGPRRSEFRQRSMTWRLLPPGSYPACRSDRSTAGRHLRNVYPAWGNPYRPQSTPPPGRVSA
jgi:hypothetical protein